MGAYKIRQYCRKCKSVTTATMDMSIEWLDGRAYETGVNSITCDYCGSTEVSDYNECPICKGEKDENEFFCAECYETTAEHLEELKNKLGACANDFEEIVCNVLGL